MGFDIKFFAHCASRPADLGRGRFHHRKGSGLYRVDLAKPRAGAAFGLAIPADGGNIAAP